MYDEFQQDSYEIHTLYTRTVYNVHDITRSVMFNFAEMRFTFNFEDWNQGTNIVT